LGLFFDDKELFFGPIPLIWLVFIMCAYIFAGH
jgi:hypothetical protein